MKSERYIVSDTSRDIFWIPRHLSLLFGWKCVGVCERLFWCICSTAGLLGWNGTMGVGFPEIFKAFLESDHPDLCRTWDERQCLPPPNTWFFEVTEPLRYSSPLFSQMISLYYCLLVRLLGSWLIVCYPGGWWSVLCVTWKVVRRICCVSNDKKELLCTRVLFDRLWVAIRCA